MGCQSSSASNRVGAANAVPDAILNTASNAGTFCSDSGVEIVKAGQYQQRHTQTHCNIAQIWPVFAKMLQTRLFAGSGLNLNLLY